MPFGFENIEHQIKINTHYPISFCSIGSFLCDQRFGIEHSEMIASKGNGYGLGSTREGFDMFPPVPEMMNNRGFECSPGSRRDNELFLVSQVTVPEQYLTNEIHFN